MDSGLVYGLETRAGSWDFVRPGALDGSQDAEE